MQGSFVGFFSYPPQDCVEGPRWFPWYFSMINHMSLNHMWQNMWRKLHCARVNCIFIRDICHMSHIVSHMWESCVTQSYEINHMSLNHMSWGGLRKRKKIVWHMSHISSFVICIHTMLSYVTQSHVETIKCRDMIVVRGSSKKKFEYLVSWGVSPPPFFLESMHQYASVTKYFVSHKYIHFKSVIIVWHKCHAQYTCHTQIFVTNKVFVTPKIFVTHQIFVTQNICHTQNIVWHISHSDYKFKKYTHLWHMAHSVT